MYSQKEIPLPFQKKAAQNTVPPSIETAERAKAPCRHNTPPLSLLLLALLIKKGDDF